VKIVLKIDKTDLKQHILNFMEKKSYRPLSVEELAKALKIEERKELFALLDQMEKEGLVIKTRRGKYGLPQKMGLIAGTIQAHPRGFAFLIPKEEYLDDVFIAPRDLNGALNGDEVVVRYSRKATEREKSQGEVIRILKRKNEVIVGTFEDYGRYGFVVPDDEKITQDIFVSKEDKNGAKTGDKVVVEITFWPQKSGRSPEGKIIKVLEKDKVEITSIIYKYNLPQEFTKETLLEAKKIPQRLVVEKEGKRKDLRHIFTVTIDGDDARDFDDAISLELTEENNFLLGVHIADVSYFVRPGSKLNTEALERGTSVYFPDRVLPMLPLELSNGICSLNEGEDRFALSVLMEITPEGEDISYKITPSLIRVDRRLTYSKVRRALVEGEMSAISDDQRLFFLLRNMAELSSKFEELRRQRGTIDFNINKARVILDEKGKPLKVEKEEHTVAEKIIEEFMIKANETVAKHGEFLDLPFLYRVHEEPDPEKLEALLKLLSSLGYSLKYKGRKIHPRFFQQILTRAEGRKEEQLINLVTLRTMSHARYSPLCSGHFALSSHYYCHFTSPIRRYPDLVNHRTLRETFRGGRNKKQRLERLRDNLEEISEHCNERELVAEEAEREVTNLKIVEYMSQFIGEEFEGIISGVVSYGFFVELENTAQGLVHVSTLTDDYYEFIEGEFMLLGEHTHKRFRLGDPVKVRLVKANIENKQLDFELLAP